MSRDSQTELPINHWRKVQKKNFTDWQSLLNFLQLENDTDINKLIKNRSFRLNLPRRLAKKMTKRNWKDPILKQFLPSLEELESHPLFVIDPVEDSAFRQAPKLLHKYKERALLLCSSACAMHCRYCFRQNFDYAITDKHFSEEIEYVAKDTSLSEIILSGGDPLSLSDPDLDRLIQNLCKIPHIKRIRFHTRFPIGIPERIDTAFLQVMANCSKQIVFIIHCNHVNELDTEILMRLKEIQKLGIPVLSQSVLLRGVNDDTASLKHLFQKLADHGIMPYYLHQLDRVHGAKHFEVAEHIGKKLMEDLAKELSGYAIPKYVKEVPHLAHKSLI